MTREAVRRSRRVRTGALVGAAVAAMGLTVVGAPSTSAASPHRYLDPVFSSIRADADLVYGRVTTGDSVEKLRLDLYRPVGDARTDRPVLIFVHGGDSNIDKGVKRNRKVPRAFAHRGF